ncbi:Segregation and condensation protein B [Candidatus Magnetomoraceae bacterium gMMP-1]
MKDLKNIIESLIFVSDFPLSIQKLKQILSDISSQEIHNVLEELVNDYEIRQSGFYLCEVAGGYQLRSRPEYKEWIKLLNPQRPVRLGRAAYETLAIIAYNQPIVRSEIEKIRGVDCGGIIHKLLDFNLIRIIGRKEVPGRPMLYSTTKRFLEVFELKDLKDLPLPEKLKQEKTN